MICFLSPDGSLEEDARSRSSTRMVVFKTVNISELDALTKLPKASSEKLMKAAGGFFALDTLLGPQDILSLHGKLIDW